MYRIIMLSLAVIFFGAGCVPFVQQENESEIAQETSTSYVMSSGIVMLTVPTDWSVRQLDAGGASVVEAYGDDPANKWTYIIVSSPADLDSGEQVSYESWLEQYELAGSIGTREVGGIVMDKYEFKSPNGESEQNYTAVLNPDRPLYVRVRVPTFNTQAEQILDSIIFSPTNAQSSGAQIIR